ncbi:amino acid/polyamine/organocation transporter (APC superfamily) [Asanoa ferruginea]|uniref:Amino acid/polyamine/organocation transporter (APC superfamily) n=1 Tax=Asanoa ferruginea TaxID=53367 RepID=A0A3D9ZM04_9ACTN|nr:amino acid permease [Asanoa ferruginea]REF97879.1 amino acid/polyamine/organocation transporter (APC superfamily) [Asanoa ferruginea]GIF52564.1 amino acid transporter [Asanoa ferruginea]
MTTTSPATGEQPLDDDAQRLAELGYKQELRRKWSGFSNFAISFSIISILAGCFTTFGQAWNNGGPVAISWGWPLISIFILIIGFCMSELVSAYPTAGGIYWWAATMGKPVHGWFTGWLNLVGLVAVTASVDYGCATFLNLTLSALFDGWAGTLNQAFLLFVIILALHGIINIYGHAIIDVLQNISVWWHVAGAAAVVLILIIVPDHHQSFQFVFTERFNNSGFGNGDHNGLMFWFFILPLGFLLTQYTITGFDACAHVSEETRGASHAAARGLWQSIFYSAIGGWILLLAFLFAATDVDAINKAGGFSGAIFETALTPVMFKIVIVISTIGQFFCGMSCVTSMSRMTYAFSRDRAVPGWRLWSKVDRNGTPVYAIIAGTIAGGVLTLPALYQYNGIPVAFYAVVSVAVIGLYLAFLIPIALRLRMGDRFRPGPWTLGRKYKVLGWIAVIEIAIISIYFIMPFTPAAVPFSDDFTWSAVNYAPLAIGGVLLAVWLWWRISARHWFTGPRRTIEEQGVAPDVANTP